MEFLSCINLGFELLNEIIDIRSKIKSNQDCCDDLLKIMKNYEKYNKKEKKLVRETLKIFLEYNKTCSGSEINIKNDEQKINDV